MHKNRFRWWRRTQRMLSEDQLAARNKYLEAALQQQKRGGVLLAVRARWVALMVVGILLPFLNPQWSVLYYEAFLLAFAGIGWLQVRFARVGRSRTELWLILLDLALLTFVLVYPSPFQDPPLPATFNYLFNNFIYFFILLAGYTLSYSWRTVFGIGTWVAVLWLGAMGWVLLQPAGMTELSEAIRAHIGPYADVLKIIDPSHVNIGGRVQEVVVFYIVAAILGLNGRRNLMMLQRQADAARQRANLARYFPPTVVDRFADSDDVLGAVRAQSVAVMFIDIVGFTRLAEKMSPAEVIGSLRDFHKILEETIFRHHGTLDKFLGDGVMATFGTPESGPNDALNALACAGEVLERTDQMNADRAAAGQAALPVSIGLHYGPVILGDIGSERRLEFAALGDVVNVASRLEAKTRELAVRMLVSDDCVEEARRTSPDRCDTLLAAGYRNQGEILLRGRDVAVSVWAL